MKLPTPTGSAARAERTQRRGLGLLAELVLHTGEPIPGVLRGDQRGGDNDQPGGRILPARAQGG